MKFIKHYNIPVSGFTKGIIYNLLLNKYFVIPVEYTNKLVKSNIIDNTFSEEAIKFFEKNNLIAEIKNYDQKLFPFLKLEHIQFYDFDNVVIEIDNTNIKETEYILKYLSSYSIKSVELIFTESLIGHNLIQLLEDINIKYDFAIIINLPSIAS